MRDIDASRRSAAVSRKRRQEALKGWNDRTHENDRSKLSNVLPKFICYIVTCPRDQNQAILTENAYV